VLRTIVLTVHLVAACFIIGLVLLQKGKGAEAGTGFGAGASATVFCSRGSSNFLSHATAVLVALFFATSLTLAYLAGHRAPPTSLLEQTAGDTTTAPTAPAATPAPGTAVPAPPAAESGDALPQLPAAPQSMATTPGPGAAPASGGDETPAGGSDN
jgi:preprotein translocase subunit SecG